MKNKWLVILLIASFIKGLVWMFSTPIFQIPDEPSHFSYVQFLAEKNQAPHPRRDFVSSKELLSVAKIVNFNWQIQHPVWKKYPSDWLTQINQLSSQDKKDFASSYYLTSLKRPGLYYFSASLVYRLFSNQTFLWRFFAIRVFSLLCQIMIIWLTYQICQKLLKKSELSLATAAMVSFHPGFSFILSGISYEALGVLIATLFIYLVVIKTKIIWLLLTAVAGVVIKPDLIFLWLLFPFYLPKKPRVIAFSFLILSFISFVLINPIINQVVRGQYLWLDKYLYVLPLKDYADYAQQLSKSLLNGQIFSKSFAYLQIFIKVHYHQIFAWYWGVFGWLEKTMPPLTYTVLKILSVVSLIGIFKNWRKLWKLLLFVLIQAAVIIANDWLVFITNGQIYGIQGRYFLPAIGAQMILFTYGLSRFISPKILIGLAVLLNLIGLFSLFQYFGNVWF